MDPKVVMLWQVNCQPYAEARQILHSVAAALGYLDEYQSYSR